MHRVTVSREYQIAIPQAVCEALGIHPGQMVRVIPYDNRIELIPMRHPREFRGSMRGMNTDLTGDDDRL